jgi:hypothetical protein
MEAKEPLLLDSEELSTELKVPKATLDQWAYRRVGPAYIKVGRHRRYRRVDVERWLDAHTAGGDAA